MSISSGYCRLDYNFPPLHPSSQKTPPPSRLSGVDILTSILNRLNLCITYTCTRKVSIETSIIYYILLYTTVYPPYRHALGTCSMQFTVYPPKILFDERNNK